MTGIKRHLLVLVLVIGVFDAVAAAVFYHLHLDREGGTRQQAYVGIWTLVSAVIVAVQLRKIRVERRAAMGTSAARRTPSSSPTDRPPP